MAKEYSKIPKKDFTIFQETINIPKDNQHSKQKLKYFFSMLPEYSNIPKKYHRILKDHLQYSKRIL